MASMASQRDYYEILEVTKTASGEEIKRSYKKIVIKNHPDKNPGDEEAIARFKEAAEAYEVLSDPDKRSRYDRFGHAGVQAGAGGGQQFHDLGEIFEHFGDLFEGFGFFGGKSGGGGRRGRGGATKGGDIRSSVSIDLASAASGCEREIHVKRKKPCVRCKGSGAEPGTEPARCDYCGGQGQVIQSQGFFRVQTTCPACRGAGQIVRHKCNTCFGSGRQDEAAALSVKIPAGIEDEMQLCVRGEGESGTQGGPSGDLYVLVNVKEHSLFRRQGPQLRCRVPLSYSQAALGTTVEIPLIRGKQSLEIPPGTQPGDVITLRGKGMPELRGGRSGDLHVEIQLEVPRKLEPEQEVLIRKLAEFEHRNVLPHTKSWFDRLKDLWKNDKEEEDAAT